MRKSIKKGLGFGVTSGIITTLGLMIGLYSTTHSKFVVFGGILVIAVADAMSDALGMHLSEEISDKNTTQKEIWESTLSTLLFKFLSVLIFIIPLIFLELKTAIVVSIIIGLIILALFSYLIANKNQTNPYHVVAEHIVIAILVIIITYYVGRFASTLG